MRYNNLSNQSEIGRSTASIAIPSTIIVHHISQLLVVHASLGALFSILESHHEYAQYQIKFTPRSNRCIFCNPLYSKTKYDFILLVFALTFLLSSTRPQPRYSEFLIMKVDRQYCTHEMNLYYIAFVIYHHRFLKLY